MPELAQYFILFLAAAAHCGVVPDDPCYREDTNCYEKGVNGVGTVPYLPEIWACELACKDTSGCNWFTWYQQDGFHMCYLLDSCNHPSNDKAGVSARWIPHVLSFGQLQPSFQRQGWCISKMDSTCAIFWTAATILPTTRLVSQERWMNAHQTRLQQEVQHGLVQKVITNSVLSKLKKIFHIVIQFKRFFHFYLMQKFG